MVSSAATTVPAYLASLPADRRAVMQTILDHVRAALPPGYQETMNWGMISWEIPLSRYPVTYNKQPLSYAALAAQKNNYALYLMFAKAKPSVQRTIDEAFAAAGKKLDMGKGCLRFKSLEALPPLDFIGPVISALTPDEAIALFERVQRESKTARAAAKGASGARRASSASKASAAPKRAAAKQPSRAKRAAGAKRASPKTSTTAAPTKRSVGAKRAAATRAPAARPKQSAAKRVTSSARPKR